MAEEQPTLDAVESTLDIVSTDSLEATIDDATVIFTGTIPAFRIVEFEGDELQIVRSHNNAMVVCTNPLGARIVLPKQATTPLPDGFACTCVLDVDTGQLLDVVSEDAIGEFGLPLRRAAYYSDQASPRSTFAPPHMTITLVKLRDDRWLVTGHYVP